VTAEAALLRCCCGGGGPAPGPACYCNAVLVGRSFLLSWTGNITMSPPSESCMRSAHGPCDPNSNTFRHAAITETKTVSFSAIVTYSASGCSFSGLSPTPPEYIRAMSYLIRCDGSIATGLDSSYILRARFTLTPPWGGSPGRPADYSWRAGISFPTVTSSGASGGYFSINFRSQVPFSNCSPPSELQPIGSAIVPSCGLVGREGTAGSDIVGNYSVNRGTMTIS
jgi:hypothetical protein